MFHASLLIGPLNLMLGNSLHSSWMIFGFLQLMIPSLHPKTTFELTVLVVMLQIGFCFEKSPINNYWQTAISALCWLFFPSSHMLSSCGFPFPWP